MRRKGGIGSIARRRGVSIPKLIERRSPQEFGYRHDEEEMMGVGISLLSLIVVPLIEQKGVPPVNELADRVASLPSRKVRKRRDLVRKFLVDCA